MCLLTGPNGDVLCCMLHCTAGKRWGWSAGNSGGPLLDSRGRLIGVNTMIYSPSGVSSGIGFAIPADTVKRVVNQVTPAGPVDSRV